MMLAQVWLDVSDVLDPSPYARTVRRGSTLLKKELRVLEVPY